MEINIKRKKKPVWPWLVALLILGVIIWILYTQFGDEIDEQIENVQDTSLNIKQEPELRSEAEYDEIAYYDEVKDFVNYIENNEPQEEIHPNFTANATVYLAQALSRLVDKEHLGDQNIEVKREAFLASVEAILQDSTGTMQSLLISEAFNNASALMTAMQKKDYPNLKSYVSDVERVAKTIEVDNLSLEYRSNIKEFFVASKIALQAISEIDTY
ncbi:hypothetical protein BH23BAC1_BH23BAC1_13230 [soil metagenome]